MHGYTRDMKDTAIIVGMAAVAVVIGVVIFLNGGGSNSANTQQSAGANNNQVAIAVPFTELTHGTQSTVKKRTNYLITSSVELNQLWKMTDASGEVPTVDFTQNDVIAVFAGTEPTAGYTVAVAKVEDSATARAVTVTLAKPGGSCILAQSLTAPYQIVVFTKSTLPLTHEDQTTTLSCLQ